MPQFLHGALSPIVSLFVNELWEPIKQHIGYCLGPESNVRNLAKAAADLKDTRDTFEEKIQLGEHDSKRPTEQARRWVESARSAEDEAHRIENEYEGRSTHIFGCSWNCFFNHSISSVAAKKKRAADELNKRTPRDDSIFSLLPPVGRELPLPPNIVGQNEYRDEIVGYIAQGATSFIGICGMGGAGKTTLLKQLNNVFSSAAEMRDFDHVIYVEVGQQQDLCTVQRSIASQLGLSTPRQDESSTSRSATLHSFLKGRRFLLLIDDLWQTLDLVRVGVPQGSGHDFGRQKNRQVVIITTRLQHVCHAMQAHAHVIVLRRLKLDEAWSLFEANAGCGRLPTINTGSSSRIRGYAKNIVEKCGGLPLALKIVGQAMASKRSEHEWEHTVMLLQRSQFHQVPDAGADLYHVLYISYEHLPDERTKKCFLFFVLTTHNFVYVPYTLDFWMAHGLIGDDGDVLNSYRIGHSVVGCLKRACLLEEHPRGESYLRMHDIVRDLVLWIVATKQGHGPKEKWLVGHRGEAVVPEEWSTATRISVTGQSDVAIIPDSCSRPRLLTLLLPRNTRICKVPRGFFTTAPSLTFLDLGGTSIQELPSDIGALVNLQHLNLSETQIQSIPVELQLCKRLRYLYLGYTVGLTIPDGTISALTMLRVLDLYSSGPFTEEKTRAYIEELESLKSLQFLGFTVTDHDSLGRVFNMSRASMRFLHVEGIKGLRALHVSPALVGKTRAQQLDTLALHGMESLEELLIGETDAGSDWYFRILDLLVLRDLRKLGRIVWRGVVPRACLPLLRVLQMEGCHGIRTVVWIKLLPCLEEVHLARCDSMLELVADDDEEGGALDLEPSADSDSDSAMTSSFPRLKVLGLSVLGNLRSICDDDTVGFPCLQRLLVYECCVLETLPCRLLREERAPLVLGQRDWWEKLGWEDAVVRSALCPFFRELPASFQGSMAQVYSALNTYM